MSIGFGPYEMHQTTARHLDMLESTGLTSQLASLVSIPSKPRAVLTKHEVVSIYLIDKALRSPSKVARYYGVSEKTIRDIWSRRTWASETWHLDLHATELEIKRSGRPVGSRDARPRMRKNRGASSHACASAADESRTQDISFACGQTMPWLVESNTAESCSLDEQLHNWELGQCHEELEVSDPFFGDWSPPSCHDYDHCEP